MERVSLSVHDYERNKLCDLYDSAAQLEGQAYNVSISDERKDGWKEVGFALPFVAGGKKNFRWNFIKADYLLRCKIGEEEDWYVVQQPKRSKNGRIITDTVRCVHLSTLLKTKNLFMVFDDENGIGTLQTLAARALTNTGWTLGTCDTLYERDGVTEKIRSLKSDGKKGAYSLISSLCDLFKAYPIYHGDTKTVELRAMSHKTQERELLLGKNMTSLGVDDSSEALITRLYVEGEYGDYGYVGIDDVNPTGLSYLLNFDYYREIGLFTQTHETALTTYLSDMAASIAAIKNKGAQITAAENTLNGLWGQIKYAIYLLSSGSVTDTITGGGATSAQAVIALGDEITVLKATGPYRVVTAGSGGAVSWENDDVYGVKFITQPSGSIGAKQVAIEAKEILIDELTDEYNAETDTQKKANLLSQIATLNADVALIYSGTQGVTGLYDSMRTAVTTAVSLSTLKDELVTLQDAQATVESTFSAAMGDMLKDGYWSDGNYGPGQEEYLYQDAIDVLAEMSRPRRQYTVKLAMIPEGSGFDGEMPELNADIKLLDNDLAVKDHAYVSKRTRYPDPLQWKNSSFELSNEEVTNNGQSFESIISRVTELADLVNQKNTLYERAQIISEAGTINSDSVDGVIDVLKNKLSSSLSNWYTDDDGALIFESATGTSAMMLCGDGFMIANGKAESGEWNWRTFGTGEGFLADRITAGILSAGVVKILGTDQFYWDSDNIYIYDTNDANNQIRIGRYDGTHYGIAFTNDGGTTWQSALSFAGLTVKSLNNNSLSVDETGVHLRAEDNGYIDAYVNDEEKMRLDRDGLTAPNVIADNVQAPNLVQQNETATIPWQGSIQESLNAFPKYLAQDATLTIPAGTYTENVEINGFIGSLTVQTGGAVTIIGGISVRNCTRVSVLGLSTDNLIVYPSAAQPSTVQISYCQSVLMQYVDACGYRGRTTASDGSAAAIRVRGSTATLENVIAEFAQDGVVCQEAAVVYITGCSGGQSGTTPTGNANIRYGVRAASGSHVTVEGTIPMGGTAAQYEDNATITGTATPTAGGMNYTPPTEWTSTFTVQAHCQYVMAQSASTSGTSVSQGRNGAYSPGRSGWRMGCLWFDLSSLSGRTITGATLRIRRASAGYSLSDGVAVKVFAYACAYENRGNYSTPEDHLSQTYASGNVLKETELTLDVTSLIDAGFISGGYALALYEPRAPYNSGQAHSDNYANFYSLGSAYEPTLTVTYS